MSSTKERSNAVINSKTRLSPLSSTTSNFTYSFYRRYSRITEIVIRSIQLPFGFYAVNSTNNVLKFNSNAISVTVTPGNYNTSTLAIELKSKIDTAFGDTNTTITFSTTTYKLTIARTTPFVVDAEVDVPSSTFAKLIGFYVSSTSGNSATGDGVINISGPNYIVVESAFLTKAIQHRTNYSSSLYSNVLATVPVVVSPGDIITLDNQLLLPVRLNYKFNIETTDIIDIVLKDDVGNILDLNKADIAIHLTFISE